jgi:L-galactose dehydrogenase
LFIPLILSKNECDMDYRPLGNTGLEVSVLSLGGAAIGQQYGPVSVAEVAETVHAAIDAGVNLIDTSAYYGRGQSERILGELLQGGWREKVLLCTKAGRLDKAWSAASTGHSPD